MLLYITISAFRSANSVSIYPQHFACHRQINWCTCIYYQLHSKWCDWPYKHLSFNELFCSRPKLLCYEYKTRRKKPYKRTIQTNHNFACLQLSTLSPKLIQGKFFLALTSAKEKKVDFFTVLEFENNNNFLLLIILALICSLRICGTVHITDVDSLAIK